MENNNQDQYRLQFQQFGNGVEAFVASSKTSGNHDFSDRFSDAGDSTGPDQDSVVSDSESGISGPSMEQLEWINEGLVKLVEEDKIYDLIKRRFVTGLGLLGPQTTVSAVYKNSHSTHIGQARLHTFQIYSQAVEKKMGVMPMSSTLGWGLLKIKSIAFWAMVFPIATNPRVRSFLAVAFISPLIIIP